MKHKTYFYLLATLLTFFIAFNACQEEDVLANQELQPVAKSAKIYSLFLTKEEVLRDFTNPKIAGLLNTKLSNSIEARQMTNTADSLLFEKIVCEDSNFTTYNLLLNQYSEQTPYLEYLTITKDSLNKVRAGYIKCTPLTDEIDFTKYTGDVEVFALDDVLIGSTTFINGVPQPDESNSSRIECTESYQLVQHNCTHGGNHPPGTACAAGFTNDGYYTYEPVKNCKWVEEPNQVIGDLEGSMNSLGGGDYNTQNLNILMTHLNAQEKALINDNFYFKKHVTGLVSGITELDDDYIFYVREILGYYIINYEVYQSLQNYTANPVENENKPIVIDNLLARLTENQTTGQKNFTKEAFDILNDNPTTEIIFDSNITESNSIQITSLVGFKDYITNVRNNVTFSSDSQPSNNGNPNQKSVFARVHNAPFSGIEVSVNLEKDGNIWKVKSVSSDTYGATLGSWSWTQIGNANINTFDYTTTVEVYGYENYILFSEGIGVVYKDKVKIIIKINKNTGVIYSIQYIDL